VLAWPIRAAIECGRTSLAMSYLETALTQVPTIPQAGSRAYALGLLWQAAYPGGPAMQDAVWRTVLAGMPADRHWRAVVLYRDIAATRRYESDEAAQAIIATVPPGKARTKLENAARRRELMRPRPFFQARSARNSE
jgi:hypothetical protein